MAKKLQSPPKNHTKKPTSPPTPISRTSTDPISSVSPLRSIQPSQSSNEFNLFPPTDTTINCNAPDGRVIPVDAMDLDDMLIEVYQDFNKPELSHKEYLPAMIEKFFDRYDFRMSRRSMELLMQKKHEILETVKKNTYQSCDPISSTE